MKWQKIRNSFPYLKNNPQEIYFDSSATSLKPTVVSEGEKFYYEHINANPHNADFPNALAANEVLTTTRAQVKALINAQSEQEIIFNSGATFGLNQVVFGLKGFLQAGDEIFISDLEHASNLVPWVEIAREKGLVIKELPLKNDFSIDEKQLAQMITKQTKVLSFAAISNTIGTKNDVKTIVKTVKAVNPNLVVCVDAAQSIGHEKIDVQAWGVDFLTFSAHKMYGPFGVGVLYGRKPLLEVLTPLTYGGGMSAAVDLDRLTYQPEELPARLEGGTPNIAGIYAFSKAIDFVNEIGIEQIASYETDLKAYARAAISKANLTKQLDFYNLDNDAPILLFNLKGINAQDIASYLAHDYKISVRSGAMCARLTARLGFKISVRVSFGVYSSPQEIDRLIEALKNIDHFLDHVL